MCEDLFQIVAAPGGAGNSIHYRIVRLYKTFRADPLDFHYHWGQSTYILCFHLNLLLGMWIVLMYACMRPHTLALSHYSCDNLVSPFLPLCEGRAVLELLSMAISLASSKGTNTRYTLNKYLLKLNLSSTEFFQAIFARLCHPNTVGKSSWTPGLKNKTYFIGMVLAKTLLSQASEVFLVTLTDTTSVDAIGRYFLEEGHTNNSRNGSFEIGNSFNIFFLSFLGERNF